MALLKSLGIDVTFFYQIVLFICSFFACYFLAFKKYYKLAEKRRQNTEGLDQKSGKTKLEIEELKQAYEAKAKNLYKKYQDIYQKILNQSEKQQKLSLEKKSLEITKKIKSFKENLLKEKTDKENSLKEHSDLLVKKINEKLGL